MAQLKRYKETPNTLRQSSNADFSGTKSSIDMFNNIAREASALSNQFFQDAATKARRDGTTGGKNAMSMNPDGTITAHSVPDAGEIFTQSFQDAQNHAVKSATINSMNEKLMDLSAKLQNDKNRTSVFDIESKAIVEKFINTTDPSLQKEIALEATLTQSKLARQLTNIDLQEAKAQSRADVLQLINRKVFALKTSAFTGAGFGDITSEDLNEGDYNRGKNKNIKEELISAELAADYKIVVEEINRAQKNNLITAEEGISYHRGLQKSFLSGLVLNKFKNTNSITPELIKAVEEIKTNPDNIRGLGFIKVPEGLTKGLRMEDRQEIADEIIKVVNERAKIIKNNRALEKSQNSKIMQGITSMVSLANIQEKTITTEQIRNAITKQGGNPDHLDFSAKYADWTGMNYKTAKANLSSYYKSKLSLAIDQDQKNNETFNIINLLQEFVKNDHFQTFPEIYTDIVKAHSAQIDKIEKRQNKISEDAAKIFINRGIESGVIDLYGFSKMVDNALERVVKDGTQGTETASPIDKHIVKNRNTYIQKFKSLQNQKDRLRGYSDNDAFRINQQLQNNKILNKPDFDKKLKIDKHENPNLDQSFDTDQGRNYNMELMLNHGHPTPAFIELLQSARIGADIKDVQMLAEMYQEIKKRRGTELIKFNLNPNDREYVDELIQVLSVTEKPEEIKKWISNRKNPSLDESNNQQRSKTTENFVENFINNFEHSKNNSDSFSRLFHSANPLLKVMDSSELGWTTVPMKDSPMTLSLETTEMLKKHILPGILQVTPTLGSSGAIDVVTDIAIKSHTEHKKGFNLGRSRFGPFNKENGKPVFSENTLSIWSMERHNDKELARNSVEITKVILAKTIDQNRFYSEKYQTRGSIEKIYGTADQIVGDGRLELIGIPSKPYHYRVIIHGEDGNFLPLPTEFVFNRENAQPYLDKLAENRKIGEQLIDNFGDSVGEFIKSTKIPNKAVELATDLGANVDAIVSNKKSSIKNSFVGNLIFSEASKYNDRYNRQGQPDKSAIQLIMKHEGFVGDTGNSKTTLIKKNDTKGSVVGHGMNLKFMEKNERDFYNRVTRNGKLPMKKDDAAELTRMRVSGIVSKFNKTKSFKWASMSRNRKDALINVVYQNGWSGFTKGFEETVKLIKAGEWTKASEEIVKSSWGRTYKTRAKEIQKLLKDG
tara:strand:- start:4556 stop:8080 length:3525 start_codon:yes stop_codon:yes gene_type:complete